MYVLLQESNKAADDDRELELEIERELEEEMRNNAEMKYKEQQALLMKEKEDVSLQDNIFPTLYFHIT